MNEINWALNFAYLAGYSAIIPLVAGIYFFSNISKPLKWLVLIIAASLTIDSISFYVYNNIESKNTLKYIYLFHLIQIFIFSIIIKNIKFSNHKLKSILFGGFIICGLVVFFLLARDYNDNLFNKYASSLKSLSFIVSALVYFWDFSFYAKIEDEDFSPIFYLMTGILIYNVILIVLGFSAYYLTIEVYQIFYNVKHLSYIFYNLLIAYIFFKDKNIKYV